MNNIILMYHYVQKPSGGMRGITPEKFADQVKRIKSKFLITSLADALVANPSDSQTCVLSFDDGLKDSFLSIFPVLLKEKLTGAFFISTRTLTSRDLLHVQKRHLLLARYPSSFLLEKFNDGLPRNYQIEIGKTPTEGYMDDVPTSALKWTLDNTPVEIVRPLIDSVFLELVGSPESFWEKTYLSEAEIETMLDAGMEFGTHGHTHRQLDTLSMPEQEAELTESTNVMKSVLKKDPEFMSYPSGGYNESTIELLRKLKYRAALTTNSGENSGLAKAFELNRIDCANFDSIF